MDAGKGAGTEVVGALCCEELLAKDICTALCRHCRKRMRDRSGVDSYEAGDMGVL